MYALTLTSDRTSAAHFKLDTDGALFAIEASERVYFGQYPGLSEIDAMDAVTASLSQELPMQCSLSGGSNPGTIASFTCLDSSYVRFEACSGVLQIAQGGDKSCDAVALSYVIPI